MGTTLTATLKKEDKILAFDSFNQVGFDIKRIVLKGGQSAAQTGGVATTTDKIVYARGGTGDASKLETLKKYITFTPIQVRVDSGTATYSITSKDIDVDVILDATVAPKDKNGEVAFTKTSNELILEVRSEALKITPTTGTAAGDRFDTSYNAGIAKNITFDFSITKGEGGSQTATPTDVKRPMEVRILDDVDGTVLLNTTKITTNSYRYDGVLLNQAGSYRFEFVDGNGRYGTVPFTIMPAKPVRLDAIASSSIFVKGQKDTILVRAMDAFGNIARGNLLNIDATVSGG